MWIMLCALLQFGASCYVSPVSNGNTNLKPHLTSSEFYWALRVARRVEVC